MNHQLKDIELRFVTTKLELTDEEGNVQTTVSVKQLQIQKIFIDLESGQDLIIDWTPVPEITDDDVLVEDAEADDTVNVDTPTRESTADDLQAEEAAINRVESAIKAADSSQPN